MGFRMNISMKLVYLYMASFFNFSPTYSVIFVHYKSSNLRLVVGEDDNVNKVKLERVKTREYFCIDHVCNHGD